MHIYTYSCYYCSNMIAGAGSLCAAPVPLQGPHIQIQYKPDIKETNNIIK